MKKCPKCNKVKKIVSFYPRSGVPYLRSWCKECSIQKALSWQKTFKGKAARKRAYWKRKEKFWKVDLQRQRELRKLNPERYRGYDLKKMYGITLKGWNKLFNKQGKRCAICKCKKPNIREKWFTDHDHKTDKVRNILCGYCNCLLGYSLESVKILKAAIKYLRRHECKSNAV